MCYTTCFYDLHINDTAQTDHMLSVEWTAHSGWGTPRIHPCAHPALATLPTDGRLTHCNTVDKVALAPHASVLNFAQTCFEGFKAYRTPAGRVALFRPDMNMKRMQTSARRATLPVRPPPLYTPAWD